MNTPPPSANTLPATAKWPVRVPVWPLVLGVVCLLSLLSTVLMWQKLGRIQDGLAKNSASSSAIANEAKLLAKTSTERSDEAQAKLALLEAKVAELRAQRSQVEALLQNAARARDDILLSDLESSLRLAEQHAQLTGNAQPLLLALQQATARLERAGLPAQMGAISRAISRDIERIQTTSYADIPNTLVRLDDLMETTEDLTLIAQATHTSATAQAIKTTTTTGLVKSKSEDNLSFWQLWWQQAWAGISNEALQLVQVDRIDQPDAALLSPEQAFFLRQNLKLQLLNARLSLLSRRFHAAQADLQAVRLQMHQYFDHNGKAYAKAMNLLVQLQAQAAQDSLPQAGESLSAINTANAALAARMPIAHAVLASTPP